MLSIRSIVGDTASVAATLVGAPIDANGNLASDGLTSYTWNARNQVAGLSGAASASFAYDGMSRRRSKTIGGATTNFLYDGANIVQELSGTTPVASLLTSLDIDETFTRSESGGTSTLLVDALRSTLALTDATGAVQTQYTFDPFGATTASGAANANAFQFTGRENDTTGLYFSRMRFYDPGRQRFMSEDPLGEAVGTNLFEYVSDNPIDYADPLGLKPQPGFGPGGGKGGGPGGCPASVPEAKVADPALVPMMIRQNQNLKHRNANPSVRERSMTTI